MTSSSSSCTSTVASFSLVTHRLFSLVMILLTLNVSAAEALRVCASQAKHEMQHATKHEGCEKPEPAPVKAPTTCCDAMASCTATLEIDGAADQTRVIPDRDIEMPAATRAPSALERTPEPPPPKGLA